MLTIYSPFSEVAEAWFNDLLNQGRSVPYIDALRSILTHHVFPLIGEKAISQINHDDALDLKRYTERLSFSTSFQAEVLLYPRAILRYAKQNHLTDLSPFDGIKITYHNSIPSRRFTEEECQKLLHSFNHITLRNLYRFIYFSGIPLREAAALKVSNFSESERSIFIQEKLILHRDKTGPFHPTACPRKVTIPPEAVQCILDELSLKQHKPHNPEAENIIFTNRDGSLINLGTANTANRVIKFSSGILDFKPLQLRDNFLLRCMDEGIDDQSLETYLGIKKKSMLLMIQGKWESFNRVPYELHA